MKPMISEKSDVLLQFYSNYGLTQRETEILSLLAT
jgi:hypothetical protein